MDFENCVDSNDKITIGIVDTNFSIGDVIKYNNICYKLNTDQPIDLATTNVNIPDFIGPNACSDCQSTL